MIQVVISGAEDKEEVHSRGQIGSYWKEKGEMKQLAVNDRKG